MQIKNTLYTGLILALLGTAGKTNAQFAGEINQEDYNKSTTETSKGSIKNTKTEKDFSELIKNFKEDKKTIFENYNTRINLIYENEKLRLHNFSKYYDLELAKEISLTKGCPDLINLTFEDVYGISLKRATTLVERVNVLGREPKTIEDVVNGFMKYNERVFSNKVSEYYKHWADVEMEDERAKVNEFKAKREDLRKRIFSSSKEERSELEKELKKTTKDLNSSTKKSAKASKKLSDYLAQTEKYVFTLNNPDNAYKIAELKSYLSDQKEAANLEIFVDEGKIYRGNTNSGDVFVVVTMFDYIPYDSPWATKYNAVKKAQEQLMDYAEKFTKRKIKNTTYERVLGIKVIKKADKWINKAVVVFYGVGNEKIKQKVLNSLEEYGNGNGY